MTSSNARVLRNGGVSSEPPLGVHPRQARSIEKRRRVFVEAMRAYAEHGVAGARIEDIVAAAGVGWGTFFNYFPRKEDVLLAAAVDIHEAGEAAMVEARAQGATVEATVAAAFGALANTGYPPRLVAAVVREAVTMGERMEALLHRHGHRPLWVTFAELLAEGQRDGSVRDDVEPAVLARLLNLSMLATHSRVGAHGEVGLPAESDLSELTTTTLRLLWEGVGRSR